MQLENKIAIVMGAGTGIGKAIAERFATQGVDVVIAGRTQATIIDTVATAIRGRPLACDVTILDEVETMFAFGGCCDVLVNKDG